MFIVFIDSRFIESEESQSLDKKKDVDELAGTGHRIGRYWSSEDERSLIRAQIQRVITPAAMTKTRATDILEGENEE